MDRIIFRTSKKYGGGGGHTGLQLCFKEQFKYLFDIPVKTTCLTNKAIIKDK